MDSDQYLSLRGSNIGSNSLQYVVPVLSLYKGIGAPVDRSNVIDRSEYRLLNRMINWLHRRKKNAALCDEAVNRFLQQCD